MDKSTLLHQMRLSPWLLFVCGMCGCAKTQPPTESPRVVVLEAKVTELQKQVAVLQSWAEKQSEAQAATADLANALAKQAIAKPKSTGGGFTDCWTSIERGTTYRNCRDAAGNTSKRNF